jgi:FkbM family methyltransferase
LKVFIDLGVMDGRSIKHFRLSHPQAGEFKIYGFECLPENIGGLGIVDYTLVEKAAWIHEGMVRFHNGHPAGGSVCSTKISAGISPDVYIEAPCIDFAQWMRNNLLADDYIIIKSNIEGAEYKLIERLNDQGLIRWVDKWFMCWHWDKIGMDKSEHDRIEAMLPEWFDWSDYGPRKDGKSFPL